MSSSDSGNFTFMNDVAKYFQDFDPEEMTCPVCEKEYKSVASFEKHIEKAVEGECATYRQLFANTITEDTAHEVFVDVSMGFRKATPTKVQFFRKSPSYKPMIEVVLFCQENEVDVDGYLTWVRSASPWIKHLNQLLSYAMEDSTLKQFRQFLIENEEVIESAGFAEQYDERLWNDELFVFKSLRKGHVGVLFMIEHYDLINRMTTEFSDVTYHNIKSLFKKVKIDHVQFRRFQKS